MPYYKQLITKYQQIRHHWQMSGFVTAGVRL